MTPEQRTAALIAGEKAAEFYDEHPFEAARQNIMRDWARSETVTEREDRWCELKALARVVDMLRSTGQTAKVAAMEIKAEEAAQTGQVDPYVHP